MTLSEDEDDVKLQLLANEREQLLVKLRAIQRLRRRAEEESEAPPPRKNTGQLGLGMDNDTEPATEKAPNPITPATDVAGAPQKHFRSNIVDLTESDAEGGEKTSHTRKSSRPKGPPGGPTPTSGGTKSQSVVNNPQYVDLGSEESDDSGVAPPTRHSRNRQPLTTTKGSNLPTSINALLQPYPDVPTTGRHTYVSTPDHWAAITSTHPVFGEAQWGLRPAGKVTWPAQSSLARDYTRSTTCLRGRVCSYDDPHVIQSCFEVVWDLYTIYADDIKKWDPLKGETIYGKNPQFNSQDGFVFEHCVYLQMPDNYKNPHFEVSYTCAFCRRKETMTLSKSMILSLGCGLLSRDEWVAATVCQMSGATKCRNSWCIDVGCVVIEEANLTNWRGKAVCMTQGRCVCMPAEEGSYREDCLLERHMTLQEGRAKTLQLLKRSNIEPDSKGHYYARIKSYKPRLIFRADS